MHKSLWLTLAFLLAALVTGGTAAHAGKVNKSFPFALDKWYDLGATDGPVTLHRIRIVHETGFTKSKLFRPGNDEHLETIKIEIEYTNTASRDWKARLDINWKDASGTLIDGYQDSENLDDSSHHDRVTVTLSTLRYGLDKAKQLHVGIEFYPD